MAALCRNWQRVRTLRHRQTAEAEGALARLKALVGVEVNAPLTLRESLEHLVGPSGGRLSSTAAVEALAPSEAADVRPDVKEAEAEMASAESRVDRARQEAKLDVNLFGASYLPQVDASPRALL